MASNGLAPWQIAVTAPYGPNSKANLVAYAYALGGGSDVAPTFTTVGVADNKNSQVFQFSNTRTISPTGHVATNNGNSSTITCPAITATDNHSLALLSYSDGNGLLTGVTWPPSGWTDISTTSTVFKVATRSLLNAGDSTGSVSTPIGGVAKDFGIINMEIMGM